MRNFVKGVLAGAFISVLAGTFMKKDRKPELKRLLSMDNGTELGGKTGKIVKGMAKSVGKMMK
ncbi:MAG: hypothetical protein ACOY31_00735 [Bacillota bacterium]